MALITNPTMLHEVRHNGIELIRAYILKTGNRKAGKLARELINTRYTKVNKQYIMNSGYGYTLKCGVVVAFSKYITTIMQDL